MASCTCTNTDTSHGIKIALSSSFCISSIMRSVSSDLKSAMATQAPSLAAAMAQALPIPDNPPVINTILFPSFFMLLYVCIFFFYNKIKVTGLRMSEPAPVFLPVLLEFFPGRFIIQLIHFIVRLDQIGRQITFIAYFIV